MSPSAQTALAEIGPCCNEQVADRTFNIVYFDLLPDRPSVLAKQLIGLLVLNNHRQVRTLWVSRRGNSANLLRDYKFSDWVDIRVPRDSQKERTMLALRQRSLDAHHQRIIRAIRAKIDYLTARFSEGTFRRKHLHPEIAEAIFVLCEERNRQYLRNPDLLEQIISGIRNGGPFVDLLYREKIIDLETCVCVASAWQARMVEDHLFEHDNING
ncbi:MAG: hypothetical protein V1695_04220 [Candidatus Uhrbacteria bacterium]